MHSQVEGTEGYIGDAEAARSHVLPELASRDSDVEASNLSSLSDENVLERAAVVASSFTESAMPSHSMQDVVIATTNNNHSGFFAGRVPRRGRLFMSFNSITASNHLHTSLCTLMCTYP